ncbi:hypothetical protein ACRW9N_13535 [Listeria aquatica]|uniref:Lmo2079 family surface lipoprotein n=1 Tax=Listeria aquatica TaxID=1494960 RepID=UPI003EF86CEF
MKKGLFLSVLLVFMLALAGCGETAQEKFVDTYKKQTDLPEKYTQSVSFKVDSFEQDGLDAQTAAIVELLKQMQVTLTSSVDTKAEKSSTDIKLVSKGSMKMNVDLTVLSDMKSGEFFIPLKNIVGVDSSVKALIDGQTSGAFSEITKSHPELKDKYLSSKTIAELAGTEEPVKTSGKTVKATKDLQEEVTKMMTDYLNGLDEKRFSEGKNETVEITLDKKDFSAILKKAHKMLGKANVKKDIKTIASEQGASKDFDDNYAEFRDDLERSIKNFDKNNTVKISMPISMKTGKDDKLESMTMKIKIDNSKDRTDSYKMAATLKLTNKDFVKLPAFPKSSEVLSGKELETIIQEAVLKVMYGDKIKTSDLEGLDTSDADL